MKNLFRFLLPILIVVLIPVVPALAAERSGNIYWAPPTVTTGGEKVDTILNFIFWLTLVTFILTQVVYVIYLVRYRRRPGRKAHYSHGNNALELVWTAIPTAIFLLLAVWSNHVWFELTETPPPEDALTIDIVSYQYGWDMRYPGPDGKLGAASVDKMTIENKFGLDPADPAMVDDFASTELVIPVGRPVHVLLRSRDVIHSFYVPEFRLYQDAVPGRTIKWVWFQTTAKGEFELACSQLCGVGHYNMKARIRIVSEEEYDKWVAEKVAGSANVGPLAQR